MQAARLSGLDGLRGSAALVVLLYHVLVGRDTNGFLGVDFFFMLSGYVMARTYEERLASPGAAGRFMVARIRRLWPTMALASLVALPWLWWHVPDRAAGIAIANLLLLPTPSAHDIYILNPPAWSILFELIANGIHAAILWRLSGRQLGGLLCLLMPLLTLFALRHGSMDMVAPEHLFTRGLVRLMCPYVIGILLYRCWRDCPPLRVPAVFTWTAMPAYFVLGSALWGAAWLPDLLFVLVTCPLLIAGGLQSAGSRLGTFLGAISFPLYAIHGPILMILREFQVPAALQFLLALAGGIAFAGLLSLASGWLGRRRLARPQALAAATAQQGATRP